MATATLSSCKAAYCGCNCGCDDTTGVCPATGGSSACANAIGQLPCDADICYTSTQFLGQTLLVKDNFNSGVAWVAGFAPSVATFNGSISNSAGVLVPGPYTVVYFSPCEMYPFTGSGPSFGPGPGITGSVKLTFDYGLCAYLFTDCAGNVYQFSCQGAFQKVYLLNGNYVLNLPDDNGNYGNPNGSQTSVTDPTTGDTTTTTTQNTYTPSGPSAGQLASQTLSRQVNDGPGTLVSQVLYTYYGNNDPSGSPGDLQSVTTQVMQGTTWVSTSTTYYRYYTTASSIGFQHGLKFVLGDEAFRRLEADPRVTNPFTASDSIVAQYADNYYEYDSLQRVTKAVTMCGRYTYLYSYVLSSFGSSSSSSSSGLYDPNTWYQKTTMTRPDGNQEITYSNYFGQVMLTAVVQMPMGTPQWITYHQFNANSQEISEAEPSAVVSYSDAYPNLDVQLQVSSGLINLTQYYASTTATSTSSGGVIGLVQNNLVQQGTGGTPILVHSYQYFAQTAGGVTVYPVAVDTVYTDTLGLQPINTSYNYTYYPGLNQLQQQITYLPVVLASQNGTGSLDTNTNVFDLYGNLTWNRGPRGFLSYMAYDLALGVVTQSIQDVDLSQLPSTVIPPAGWVTPPGGGLHLITDYEYDEQGRQTQSLGPAHNVDGQTVRTANWTVYHDDTRETWSGHGYATGMAPDYQYTLLGPVSISRTDEPIDTSDSIQAARLCGGGTPITDGDCPPRTASRRVLGPAGQARSLTAAARRLLAERTTTSPSAAMATRARTTTRLTMATTSWAGRTAWYHLVERSPAPYSISTAE